MTRLPKHLPALAQPAAVRHAIARALLGVPPSATLGSVTLMPHQVDAVARLSVILQRHHVALLADDVGLGKTFVALAVAQRYAHAHIIAPAALLPMWQSAMARANCLHATITSVQRYSLTPSPSPELPDGCLVIIDEAHHLRNRRTVRYDAVASVTSGRDVLLVSATPVHNAPRDLRQLLALSLGQHASRLDDHLLATVVVRRTHHDARPSVREQPVHPMPHDPIVLNAILALPAPLPAHDGAVAGALIKLGLLRAWCSSDAALQQMLTKRWLRGEALRTALESGRHPSAVELRSWLVGDAEVQLAFPELLASHAVERAPLLEVLTRHLDAVRALCAQHAARGSHDAARAAALRAILQEHGATPVVAFSQFAATVRAIGRALSDIAGVGVLTGQRASVASGTISRQEALDAFAPMAHGRAPPPTHQRIQLLLTTDLLAEGVNLQDAGVVVHLDLPWTDALRRQRVGRCVRVGSGHPHVSVYTFAPDVGVERVLRLQRRLQRKARWTRRVVGTELASAGVHPPSAADAASAIREEMHAWCESASAASHGVAVVGASTWGFLACVRDDEQYRLIGGRRRASASAARVVAVMREIAWSSPAPHAVPVAQWRATRRAILRWQRACIARRELGADESLMDGHRRAARDALWRTLRALRATDRVRLQTSWLRAEQMIRDARGAAADAAIAAWVARQSAEPLATWLDSWREAPVLARAVHERPAQSSRPQVASVLLLVASGGRNPFV